MSVSQRKVTGGGVISLEEGEDQVRLGLGPEEECRGRESKLSWAESR